MKLAVIFDMDGVLVDSFEAHRVAWMAMFQAEKIDFDPAQFTAVFGRTSREIIALLCGPGRYTDAQVKALDDQRECAYRDAIRGTFPAMPGARELITALSRDGFALALGSSGPPENAELVLEALGVRDLFDAVVTGRDVRKGKPDPEVFITAASRLGIAPNLCAVIEDAPAGIAAAIAGGMLGIGLASTGRTHQDLEQARVVVDSLFELSPASIRQLLSPRHALG
ncbi:MAG: HAD family phosphatase [Verrucomicrobiota bacterium]